VNVIEGVIEYIVDVDAGLQDEDTSTLLVGVIEGVLEDVSRNETFVVDLKDVAKSVLW
jgi:hypothetical protein